MGRNIKDILYFRQDISPFLVHLTKSIDEEGTPAKEVLKKIIKEKKLIAGDKPISDARLIIKDDEKEKQFCRAISFTETPISEVHCLLEIDWRSVQLEEYGLVFFKDNLRKKGVSPVFYINNELGDKKEVLEALCEMVNYNPKSAMQILPLISGFGKKFYDPNKEIDFLWEREWRYPSINEELQFDENDVFVGICPDGEIDEFGSSFQRVQFIDCQKNMKWYAKTLVEAKDRFPDFKYSVV